MSVPCCSRDTGGSRVRTETSAFRLLSLAIPVLLVSLAIVVMANLVLRDAVDCRPEDRKAKDASTAAVEEKLCWDQV